MQFRDSDDYIALRHSPCCANQSKCNPRVKHAVLCHAVPLQSLGDKISWTIIRPGGLKSEPATGNAVATGVWVAVFVCLLPPGVLPAAHQEGGTEVMSEGGVSSARHADEAHVVCPCY